MRTIVKIIMIVEASLYGIIMPFVTIGCFLSGYSSIDEWALRDVITNSGMVFLLSEAALGIAYVVLSTMGDDEKRCSR